MTYKEISEEIKMIERDKESLEALMLGTATERIPEDNYISEDKEYKI